MVQKLYVAKNCIPPGLSIANLRYLKMIFCCCYLFDLIIGKLCLSHRQNKFLQKKIEKKAWFATKCFFYFLKKSRLLVKNQYQQIYTQNTYKIILININTKKVTFAFMVMMPVHTNEHDLNFEPNHKSFR